MKFNILLKLDHAVQAVIYFVARHLPRGLRVAVVTDSASRSMSGNAEPDDLCFSDIYWGAEKKRSPNLQDRRAASREAAADREAMRGVLVQVVEKLTGWPEGSSMGDLRKYAKDVLAISEHHARGGYTWTEPPPDHTGLVVVGNSGDTGSFAEASEAMARAQDFTVVLGGKSEEPEEQPKRRLALVTEEGNTGDRVTTINRFWEEIHERPLDAPEPIGTGSLHPREFPETVTIEFLHGELEALVAAKPEGAYLDSAWVRIRESAEKVGIEPASGKPELSSVDRHRLFQMVKAIEEECDQFLRGESGLDFNRDTYGIIREVATIARLIRVDTFDSGEFIPPTPGLHDTNAVIGVIRASRRGWEIRGEDSKSVEAFNPGLLRGAPSHSAAYLLQALAEDGWSLVSDEEGSAA